MRNKMKFITPLLIFTLIFPATIYASDPPTPKVTGIVQGQSAPFTGTLFNEAASARLLTEKSFAESECNLRIKYLLDKEKERHLLVLDSQKASLAALELKYDTILIIKNEEIVRLSKVALNKPNEYSEWWFLGGVASGVILAVAMFFVASESME